jgi:hypothetical protein
MGAQGTVQIDFGAFPGKSDAEYYVTGQAGITALSLVEAWIFPADTISHSADEHFVETIQVTAYNIIPTVGFRIYARNTNTLLEPLERVRGRGPQSAPPVSANPTIAGQLQSAQGLQTPTKGGRGTRLYGQFTVAWVWN